MGPGPPDEWGPSYRLLLAGLLGAAARYGISGWFQQATRSDFPWGTTLVNVTGSLVLGFLHGVASGHDGVGRSADPPYGQSVGGYTTFSTLTYETTLMMGMAADDALLRRPG